MIIPAHKIKIIYPRYQSVASLQALQSIIGLADLANPAWVKDHSTEYNYRLRNFRNSGLQGIYLGTSVTLNAQITSKYVQNPTYNSVYFDKLSKFCAIFKRFLFADIMFQYVSNRSPVTKSPFLKSVNFAISSVYFLFINPKL